MTVDRRYGEDTPFGKWLREYPELDSITNRMGITDCDYWSHQYRAHTDRVGVRAVDSIMLIEVKTNMADPPFSQRDTLRIINELLRMASMNKTGRRRHVRLKIDRETRHVRCYGVHLLQMSGDRPDNSANILWDGKTITEEMLVDVWRFYRDPDHPSRELDLRRHHSKTQEYTPPLFSRDPMNFPDAGNLIVRKRA